MMSFSQFLKESSPAFRLLEGKKEYLAKFAGQPGLVSAVDLFWDVVRKRVKAPENDIQWWMSKPYSEFKAFVDGFDTRKRSIRRSDEHAEKAKKFGAKPLALPTEISGNGWEAWYVPSYEAAVELGRFYRGYSASWCISTENSSYFNDQYSSSEFVFLVWAREKGECPDGEWLKLAIQTYRDWSPNDEGDYHLWTLSDRDIQYDEDYLDDSKAASLRETVGYVVDNWKRLAGTDREKYQDELVSKYVADGEWLRKNVFEGVASFHREGNSVSCEVPFEWLDGVVDSRAGVSYDFIDSLFNGDDFDLFSFDYQSVSWEIPHDAEKAFNSKLLQAGITWEDIADIGRGLDTKLPGPVAETIGMMLDDDFYEGNGYSTVYADCQRSGTTAAAHEDIKKQLADAIGLVGTGYAEGTGPTLKCAFSAYDVTNMAKACMKNGYGNTALWYFRYDFDENAVDRYAVEEPQEGWNGFDDGMMKEAVLRFADSLKGELARQKDAPGQMMFGFDKDYLDNPRNLERGRK